MNILLIILFIVVILAIIIVGSLIIIQNHDIIRNNKPKLKKEIRDCRVKRYKTAKQLINTIPDSNQYLIKNTTIQEALTKYIKINNEAEEIMWEEGWFPQMRQWLAEREQTITDQETINLIKTFYTNEKNLEEARTQQQQNNKYEDLYENGILGKIEQNIYKILPFLNKAKKNINHTKQKLTQKINNNQ